MLTSDNHTINQLKWLYSALAGVCATYFFALFSGQSSLDDSFLLLVSTILFAMCLPLFTAFAVVHVSLIEMNISMETCDRTLNQPWVNALTRITLIMFIFAFWGLIGHFSLGAMLASLITSLCCGFLFCLFFKQLKQNKP